MTSIKSEEDYARVAALPSVAAPEVLVERLAADAELAGQRRLFLAGCGAAAQLGRALRRERLGPAPVDAAPLGQLDALALPLANQRPLELGERAHHRKHQVGHGRVLIGER